MPEMTFTVRWPDGTVEDCYSPSLVLHDHLERGRYSVADFVARSAAGLEQASDRVRARYGFACSASASSLERIRATAAAFPNGSFVDVLALEPPLPQEGT